MCLPDIPIPEKKSSDQLYKKEGDQYIPFSPPEDFFMLPTEGYWKVTHHGGQRIECKLLNINETDFSSKIEALKHADEVFQHVSKRVYSEDISLWEVVKEVLLKLEEIKTLNKGETYG